MKIFISSLKVLVAAILAILVAHLLRLDFAISAGIVAILSVQPTKRETLKTALSRFYAFLAALAISFCTYRIFGFTLPGFISYLVMFIFVCQIFHWHSAMAMDSVLVSHFISLNGFGIAQLRNECLLFAIGVGFGILMNLFLHKRVDEIERLKREADRQIRLILQRMSQRIMDLDFSQYTGECFDKLDRAILEAKIFERENFNNQLRKNDLYDRKYISMRERQKNVLQEIYKCIVDLKTVPITARTVSDFFGKVADEYHRDNDVLSLLEDLEKIRQGMKKIPLPKDRTEFEDRALLFMILQRMEEFLVLKRDFYSQNKA